MRALGIPSYFQDACFVSLRHESRMRRRCPLIARNVGQIWLDMQRKLFYNINRLSMVGPEGLEPPTRPL